MYLQLCKRCIYNCVKDEFTIVQKMYLQLCKMCIYNCAKGVFTIEVDDNIDRNEGTFSGLGTTHKINSILIQPGRFNAMESSSILGPSEKKKARSLLLTQRN